MVKIFSGMWAWAKPPTYMQRLARQIDEAREQHLEHSAVAEQHQKLAEMYSDRYLRLQTLKAQEVTA